MLFVASSPPFKLVDETGENIFVVLMFWHSRLRKYEFVGETGLHSQIFKLSMLKGHVNFVATFPVPGYITHIVMYNNVTIAVFSIGMRIFTLFPPPRNLLLLVVEESRDTFFFFEWERDLIGRKLL